MPAGSGRKDLDWSDILRTALVTTVLRVSGNSMAVAVCPQQGRALCDCLQSLAGVMGDTDASCHLKTEMVACCPFSVLAGWGM